MRSRVAMLLVLAACAAQAAEATRLTAVPASVVVLQGRSNVAAWQCRGATIDAIMTVAATPERINAVIDRVEDGNIGVWMSNPAEGRFPQPDFQLRIPVSAFRCGNRIMEGDLRRSLNQEDHPTIDFAFRELVSGVEHDIDAGHYRARIAGDLSLAGVTRRIEVVVTARRISPQRFRLSAELPLRMTQFGIIPPTALFGAIRAADSLTVRFDLTLQMTDREKHS
jgi:hypothetical protein